MATAIIVAMKNRKIAITYLLYTACPDHLPILIMAFTLVVKVKAICRKFECRKDIHYKFIIPKPGPFAKNATPRPSKWESNLRPLDYYRPVIYH